MDDAEFLEFTTYYYREQRVDLASEALRWYARSPWVRDPLSAAPMAYFFARLAQNHPSLVPDYADTLKELKDQGEIFVRNVLHSTPITVNAVERALRTPTDNDLLWVEFAVSGSEVPSSDSLLSWNGPTECGKDLTRGFDNPRAGFCLCSIVGIRRSANSTTSRGSSATLNARPLTPSTTWTAGPCSTVW